ncbi:MAG: hypothetical protein HY819_12995 [Acidobacteria bacterium]|nr:hypothetical protein [Acidobacteriota bacterium]
MPTPRGGVGSERSVDDAPKDVQELAEDLESAAKEQEEQSDSSSEEK